MRRNYATAQLLKRAVAEAWFGRLERISIREGARSTKSGLDVSHYDDVKASGGGVLIALGCHDLDLAFHITGAGSFRVAQKNLERDGPIDRKVEASIRLLRVRGRSEEECDFDFCISWLDRQDNRIELTFPEVILSTGITPNSPVLLHPRSNVGSRGQEFVLGEGAKTSNQAFFLEWDLFLRGLEEGKPSVMAASTAFLTSALIDSLYERGDAA
jgi:predicted dehydrogenase